MKTNRFVLAALLAAVLPATAALASQGPAHMRMVVVRHDPVRPVEAAVIEAKVRSAVRDHCARAVGDDTCLTVARNDTARASARTVVRVEAR